MHHRCHRHRWQSGGKFATGINDTSGKLPPVSTTPAANFATSSPCVVDTGGKFATGVNDTGDKFAAGANDAGGKLPLVSTIPAANVPPASLKPVANNGNNIRLQTPESELEGCAAIDYSQLPDHQYSLMAARAIPYSACRLRPPRGNGTRKRKG